MFTLPAAFAVTPAESAKTPADAVQASAPESTETFVGTLAALAALDRAAVPEPQMVEASLVSEVSVAANTAAALLPEAVELAEIDGDVPIETLGLDPGALEIPLTNLPKGPEVEITLVSADLPPETPELPTGAQTIQNTAAAIAPEDVELSQSVPEQRGQFADDHVPDADADRPAPPKADLHGRLTPAIDIGTADTATSSQPKAIRETAQVAGIEVPEQGLTVNEGQRSGLDPAKQDLNTQPTNPESTASKEQPRLSEKETPKQIAPDTPRAPLVATPILQAEKVTMGVDPAQPLTKTHISGGSSAKPPAAYGSYQPEVQAMVAKAQAPTSRLDAKTGPIGTPTTRPTLAVPLEGPKVQAPSNGVDVAKVANETLINRPALRASVEEPKVNPQPVADPKGALSEGALGTASADAPRVQQAPQMPQQSLGAAPLAVPVASDAGAARGRPKAEAEHGRLPSRSSEAPPTRRAPEIANTIQPQNVAQAQFALQQSMMPLSEVRVIPDGDDLSALGAGLTTDTRAGPSATLATLSEQPVSHARADHARAVSSQLLDAARAMPGRPVEISLSPEELGRVRMTVAAADQSILVSIMAERPETLDLMRRNIDILTQDFQSLGYDDIAFDFGQGEGADANENPSTDQSPKLFAGAAEGDKPSPIQISLAPSAGLDLRL